MFEMKASYCIEIAKYSQWQEYKKIRLEALKKEPDAFLTTFNESKSKKAEDWKKYLGKNFLKDRSATYFIKLRGNIVGIASIYKSKSQKRQHIAHIGAVYVKPGCRGKKLGSNLIKHLLKIIKKDPKVKLIRLEVASQNEKAQYLYKKFGFEEFAYHPYNQYDGEKYIHEIFMQKILEDRL